MREFETITRHASKVLAGQLAIMAFGVIDTIVAVVVKRFVARCLMVKRLVE